MSTGGSTALSFISDLVGIPIDQVNFITCQLVALLLSCILKAWVKRAGTRLWFCLLSGIAISYFCFGMEILHIVAMGGICYGIICLYESSNMPWLVLIISMGYLSTLHLRRQLLDPGSYSLDVTGPMMVLTQKVSSLAFAVRDGKERKKDDDGGKGSTPLQQRYAVERTPSLLEFASFTFQFQSMLAGPLVMYKDFYDFIITESVPSSGLVVLRKVLTSVFFAVIFLMLGPVFPAAALKEEWFLEGYSWIQKVLYIICLTTIERTKYHHAWILADAVCNASGLGYDKEKGTWDLTTNVRPFHFEYGLSFKESLDHWNIGTGKWLRYIVYERTGANVRTVLTYMVSAFWHGFYPGYYMTFLTGALLTTSARTIRRHVRPFFLGSPNSKLFYDICTWTVTRVAFAYATFTFIVLDLIPCFIVYKKLYFFLHILPLLAMYTVQPMVYMMGGPPRDTAATPRASKETTTANKGPENGSAKPELIAQANNNKKAKNNPAADGNNEGVSLKMKTG